jgi:hypothetical protein
MFSMQSRSRIQEQRKCQLDSHVAQQKNLSNNADVRLSRTLTFQNVKKEDDFGAMPLGA